MGRRGAVRGTSEPVTRSLIAAKAPRHVTAILEALQFQNASSQRLSQLSPLEWQDLLSWCDRRQLTLLLPRVCGSSIPANIQGEIARRNERYGVRFERLKAEFFDIVAALTAAGLEFVLLKGLSHSPELTPDARLRAQGDLDLWLIGPAVHKAKDTLQRLGYVSVGTSRSRHLSPLARPCNWKWAGDLFDPDMPISVELHYELWSEDAEYVPAQGIEAFWARRVPRSFDGHEVSVLCNEDLVGFAALHLLLHVLHGELPLERAWELARFLDTHSDDIVLWQSWRGSHSGDLKRLELISFALVTRWFSCRWPDQLDAELLNLPEPVRLWLEQCSLAPLVSQWSANKREVWLHLALIDGWSNKVRVLARRLFPLSFARFGTQEENKPSLAEAPRILLQGLKPFSRRLLHHLCTLSPTIYDGLRLRLLRKIT